MSIHNQLSSLPGNSDEYIEEGIGQVVKQSLNRDWQLSNQDSKLITYKKFKSNTLTEEEYEDMLDTLKTLRKCETYREYKPAFEKLCKFCHIVPDGTVIRKIQIKSGSEKDRNYMYVEYAYNTRKIKLEDGQKLFHVSKIDGIQKLTPFFRGKSERGYLYYKPRIYLTVYKKMPKIMADYGAKTKMHHYEVTGNVSEVYVDPLLPYGAQGAVYVETNSPIPVKKFTP